MLERSGIIAGMNKFTEQPSTRAFKTWQRLAESSFWIKGLG